MTDKGVFNDGGIGLLVIDDPDGDFGVAAAPCGDDPEATAETLIRQALSASDCPGELPELVWVFQAPGHEEKVIAGLRSVVGDRCPIIGGSSADNEISGAWRQMHTDGVLEDGIVVAVLFPSGGVSYGFQGGYEPAGQTGIVTAVAADAHGRENTSGRRILAIDGRPAAEVYNNWIGGGLSDRIGTGGSVLIDTTMAPLGVEIGRIRDVPQYRLIHPESISPDGALNTFAAVAKGERLHDMRGERAQLVKRAGRMATQAATGLQNGPAALAGGLVVYCAGCKMAIDDQVSEMVGFVSQSLAGTPFLGCFTFGEQGCMAGQNVHGNLMISTVAFGQ